MEMTTPMWGVAAGGAIYLCLLFCWLGVAAWVGSMKGRTK